MKNNYKEINKYEESKEKITNYDEANKYDFYAKYYMHYAIGTRFEDCVEISKKEYSELKQKLKNSKEAMIRIFATYAVGFYKNEGTYVIQTVDKDIYYCLYNSQRYEKNKVRNENFRHIDKYFNQEDITNIHTDYSLEDEVLNEIEKEEIKLLLDSILSEKQSNRFFKNKILEIPLVIIAVQDGTTVGAIEESVKRAMNNISKNYKKK
ncbi:hypothetical protein [uncultured Clostridium sp.]|uniref:hypothetical protein n=1 Tax=uncultured Clostridium sp. TaxID=59620 RepID=UPI002606D937|nr:hypothetical protein [uncultured Clostridium sp.]MCI8310291.1 hypothetical protein [Clostridia bacterium]